MDGAPFSGERAPRGPVIATVETTPTFRRLLARHRRRPGRPAVAADKAEQILSALAARDGLCPQEAGSRTRFGDARVPGCVKFELGGGYRLICHRRGGVLVALFLGNHGECHSWLRDRRPVNDAIACAEASPAPTVEPEDPEIDQSAVPLPQPAEREYTDRELRAVFAGLCAR